MPGMSGVIISRSVVGNFAELTWLKDTSKCRMVPSDRLRRTSELPPSSRSWPLTVEWRSEVRAVSIGRPFSCADHTHRASRVAAAISHVVRSSTSKQDRKMISTTYCVRAGNFWSSELGYS